MARRTRRARTALRLDVLESRTLLSSAAPKLGPLPVPDPATSLLIRFADDTSATAIQAALSPLGASITETLPHHGPSLIQLGQGTDPDTALNQLRANPHVLYAEPDAPIELTSTI